MKRVTYLAAMAAVVLTPCGGAAKAGHYGFLYDGTTYTTIAPPGPGHVPNGRLRRQRGRRYYNGGEWGFLYRTARPTPPSPRQGPPPARPRPSPAATWSAITSHLAAPPEGFLYNGATYTTIAPPGALATFVTGVSGGTVVGDYYNATNQTADDGFLYNGTTYTTIAPPGATNAEATGVSGSKVVGFYVAGGIYYGFLYNGSTYTTIAPPGSLLTHPMGVSGGNVVGYYGIRSSNLQGFLYNGTTYTTIAPPGSDISEATAVSGGNVVGDDGAPGSPFAGFLYNGTTYTTIAPPGATNTEATAVSGGNVVGYFLTAPVPPGVPEPSGLTLLVLGLATAVGYGGLRRRPRSAGQSRGICALMLFSNSDPRTPDRAKGWELETVLFFKF